MSPAAPAPLLPCAPQGAPPGAPPGAGPPQGAPPEGAPFATTLSAEQARTAVAEGHQRKPEGEKREPERAHRPAGAEAGAASGTAAAPERAPGAAANPRIAPERARVGSAGARTDHEGLPAGLPSPAGGAHPRTGSTGAPEIAPEGSPSGPDRAAADTERAQHEVAPGETTTVLGDANGNRPPRALRPWPASATGAGADGAPAGPPASAGGARVAGLVGADGEAGDAAAGGSRLAPTQDPTPAPALRAETQVDAGPAVGIPAATGERHNSQPTTPHPSPTPAPDGSSLRAEDSSARATAATRSLARDPRSPADAASEAGTRASASPGGARPTAIAGASARAAAPGTAAPRAAAPGTAAPGATGPVPGTSAAIAFGDTASPATAVGDQAPAPPTGAAVGLQQALEELDGTIQLAARQGSAQARIALAPAELGEIRIHLVQTAEGLLARVTAGTPAVAQALAGAHSELRQSLTSLGVNLTSLELGHHEQAAAHGGATAEHGHDGAAGRSGESGRHGARIAGGEADEPNSDEAIEPQTVSPGPGERHSALVDVLA